MGHKPWDRAWRRAAKARERNAARDEMVDDLNDVVDADRRHAADTGARHSLDDVIAELGISQAEIDAAD